MQSMKQTLRIALEQPILSLACWASYPILHLYKENLGLVIDSEVIPSILLMLLGTGIVFLHLSIVRFA